MSAPRTLPGPIPAPANVRTLRTAVTSLAQRANTDVTAVRDAFTSGIAPVQTVGSGSVASYISQFGGLENATATAIISSTSQLGVNTTSAG